MEQKTILAIALSVLLLFGYDALFGQHHPPLLNKDQVVENKEVINEISQTIPPTTENIDKTTQELKNAKKYDIKTKNSVFTYSDMGGTLHNIHFDQEEDLPLTKILAIKGLENTPFTVHKINEHSIVFSYANQNWQIKKTFDNQDSHLVKVRMEIKNISESSILTNFDITAFKIDSSSLDPSKKRENVLDEYSVYYNNKIFRKGSAFQFKSKEYRKEEEAVNWVGYRDHYYAFAVAPKFKTKSFEIQPDTEKTLQISIEPEAQTVAPNQTIVYEFAVFCGPQNTALIKKYDHDFEKIVAFSSFGIVNWISMAIYNAIPFLHRILGSWGVAIILVSMFIYGITYPLTFKSMLSMRKMQQVQPKIAALRERYKNDPQKLNTETMEIYRREKINPLGGCLPYLIQMPFFWALYQVLWRAQYFQGQGFLWIKDLTQPDKLFILPFSLPFLGNEVNILPILTGVLMFLQQKITSKSTGIVDEQQVTQQKMMMYILPVVMAFIFYHFASSWAIYFLIYYILSTLAQWKIKTQTTK